MNPPAVDASLDCPACGYNLQTITSCVCPECGQPFVLASPRDGLTRGQINAGIAWTAGALSVASFMIITKGAVDEPYMGFSKAAAVEQVGIGTAMIGFWVGFSFVLVTLVAVRKLSVFWLFLLLWAFVFIFHLLSCPLGYLDDLERSIQLRGQEA